MAFIDDEAFLLEACQCFAHGSPTHLQLRRKLVLDEPHSRLELAGDDRQSYRVDDLVGEDTAIRGCEPGSTRINVHDRPRDRLIKCRSIVSLVVHFRFWNGELRRARCINGFVRALHLDDCLEATVIVRDGFDRAVIVAEGEAMGDETVRLDPSRPECEHRPVEAE